MSGHFNSLGLCHLLREQCLGAHGAAETLVSIVGSVGERSLGHLNLSGLFGVVELFNGGRSGDGGRHGDLYVKRC